MGVTVLRNVDIVGLIHAGKVTAFRKRAGKPVLFCDAADFEAVKRRWPNAIELTADQVERELKEIVEGAGWDEERNSG